MGRSEHRSSFFTPHPAIEFVQELLTDGYVGEVLSTTMIGLSVPGDVVGQPNAYMLDETNRANVLTIAAGHSLDILNRRGGVHRGSRGRGATPPPRSPRTPRQ